LNISGLMMLLGGGIVAVMFYGTDQQVKTLSKLLVQRTLQQTHSDLETYFTPIRHSLDVVYQWSINGTLKNREAEQMRKLWQPLLVEFPQISSLLNADGNGDEYMLLRTDDGWLDRVTQASDWHDVSQVRRWQTGQVAQSNQETLHYDPRQRPWFQGAVARAKSRAGTQDAHLDRVYWTPPYTFFTTQQPGITASLAYFDPTGLAHVVGIDILLTDISRFTTKMNVSKHGLVFVMTDDGRMLGLPGASGELDESTWPNFLLKTPDALGIPVIDAAIKTYLGAANKREPFAFENDNEIWWGGSVDFALSDSRKLLIGVVVPQKDVIGDIYLIRYSILLILIGLSVLTLLRILYIARRYSRPLVALVEDSYRISHGDLDEPNQIATRVTEIQQLARAHDAMRDGLRNLLKLERDMQLAKQIQQKALPEKLPSIPHFKIAVWNLPADETGGDSYDVLALTKRADGYYQLNGEHADHALCMLADAAGHGVGPALSVTQVRSMLRMAARQGLQLPSVLAMINQQILEDLSGGRFITVWLGLLDAHNGRLLSYSAGQAPLIYFQSSSKACQILEADSPPIGIVDQMEVTAPQIISMVSGDFFVVLSDGIFEATNSKGEPFGLERVQRIISLSAEQTAEEVLEHIRHGLDVFTEQAQPSDDRTAVIIKCV
jgi:serine phosphatase RsbU (regulator of sigma subunit)